MDFARILKGTVQDPGTPGNPYVFDTGTESQQNQMNSAVNDPKKKNLMVNWRVMSQAPGQTFPTITGIEDANTPPPVYTYPGAATTQAAKQDTLRKAIAAALVSKATTPNATDSADPAPGTMYQNRTISGQFHLDPKKSGIVTYRNSQSGQPCSVDYSTMHPDSIDAAHEAMLVSGWEVESANPPLPPAAG